jgi:MarR family transcriptional regulator for hemolysin
VTSVFDPNESLGFLLNDVARLLRRNFNRRAQFLGLSQAQTRALAHLSRQEGVSQVKLAESLDIQPMTVGRLIDGLQDAGLVTRRPDPADRRALRLYLTEAALPLLAQMWDLAAETRDDALVAVPEDALCHVFETLRQMKQNLLEAESRAACSEQPETRAADDA